MDGFDSEFVYPSLTKEEKETLLAKKIEDIRRKNKELERRHAEIEADKKLAVGSRASVQLPAATAAVSRAPADDVGDEGEAAAATVGAVDARRVERMPPQSGDARRELQGAVPTAGAHGRNGRTPARRGRGPSNKGTVSAGGGGGGGGGGARCSSRDSSLLKFPLKKPGLGFRRFSRESLTAGRRRAWPPKKGAGLAPELDSSTEPAAACDRAADGGRMAAVRPGGATSWRGAQHRRGGSGDVATAVAAAAAAHKGCVADGVDGANGAVTAPVTGNSPPGRSGSGSGLGEAVGGAADGLVVTGSRDYGTKSGGCSDRARGSAGRSQRKNYEETRKRNSGVYEDEQPLQQQKQQQQQQQQQRRRSGTGTADGATNCSPPPAQPTRLDLEMRLTGRERRAYSAWKEERDRVDEERLGRARDSAGGWRREWDADKAEPPTPPASAASTGSAPIAAAAAAPQWPAPASSATSPGAPPARSVLSAAAPAWPYAQPTPTESASPPPQLPQQQRQQRQQHESLLPVEATAGWLAASKSPALPPPPSGCHRRAVGSGRFMSQGDRRKTGPSSGSNADSTCPATAAPREDTGDLRTRRQPAWSDSERKPPARRAPPPPPAPRSPAGSRGGRGGRGGSVGGTRGRRWPSRGGWRMQRSAYGGSASSLYRPSSRASVVEDIVIIHVEDDDGEVLSFVDAAAERGGRPAAKSDGAEAAAAAAVAELSASGEPRSEARAPAAGLASCGAAAAAMAISSAPTGARSGRGGENRKRYPDERYNSSSGRRRRGGGGRGRSQTAAAAPTASRDDARATVSSRPRVDGRAGQNKDDEWEDVADGDGGTR